MKELFYVSSAETYKFKIECVKDIISFINTLNETYDEGHLCKKEGVDLFSRGTIIPKINYPVMRINKIETLNLFNDIEFDIMDNIRCDLFDEEGENLLINVEEKYKKQINKILKDFDLIKIKIYDLTLDINGNLQKGQLTIFTNYSNELHFKCNFDLAQLFLGE